MIDSGLRLAEKRIGEPESALAYIRAAREGIDRGFELTSQLLAFAQHQELDAHAGDVNEFLRSFEPFLRYGAGPDVRVRLELGTDIPNCLIDPALFDAAVLNLVVNGRDAMPNGGEIQVVTERFVPTASDSTGTTFIRVRVVDSGSGMRGGPAKGFRSFFTTKGDRGTGIGLAQVRAFVQMVGGQVCIASKKELERRLTCWFRRSTRMLES